MTSVFLRPDADSSDGSWLNEASSGTNLFASVDDTTSTGADSDYIRSSSAQGDKVRLRLSDPGVSVTAPMVVRYRVKAEALPAALVGRLYQGASTLIAYWEELPTTSFATYTYTLTTAEFNSITDFNDLYVEFEYDSAAPHLTGNIDLWFEADTYYDSSLDPASDPAHLMLHMDGTDASTTFTDAAARHTITASGNAQIDTAQSKFGGASALFDGAGDYLTISVSGSDFAFGTGDFTLDFWIRLNDASAFQMVYDSRATSSEATPCLYFQSGTFKYYVNGSIQITSTTSLTTAVWYHVAVVRSGTSTKLFVDGVQEGGTYSDSTNYINNADRPFIGTPGDGGTAPLNGWIDELRVVKGTAIWTSNFTPPTVAYAVQTGPYNLLSCSRASTGYAQTVAGTLTSFATNELRITDKGLLVEDARTNLCIFSQDLSAGSWSKNSVTITADNIAAPDGTTTADKATNTATNGVFHNPNLGSLTGGSLYASSVYLKSSGTNTWCKVYLNETPSFSNAYGSFFNLSGSGTVGTSVLTGDGSLTSASIEALANGWYRCIIIGNTTATRSMTFVVEPAGAADNFSAVVNGDFVYFWGSQTELASFASSYVPTTATSATRAGDQVRSTGNLTSVFGGSVSSMVVALQANPSAEASGSLDFYMRYIGGENNQYGGPSEYVADKTQVLFSSFSDPQLICTFGSSLNIYDPVKIGYAQQSPTGRSLVGAGGTVATDSNNALVWGTLGIGCDGDGSITRPWYGYFQRFTAWNIRLSDATLQGLTYP